MADDFDEIPEDEEEKIGTIIKLANKGDEAPHHSSGWKVAMADLMTSLFASFLVLWLIASTSPEGRIEIASVFKSPSIRDAIPGHTQNSAKETTGTAPSIINRNGGRLGPDNSKASSEKQAKKLKQINAELRQRLKRQLGDYVNITFDEKTIVIVIKGDTLYGSGRTNANPKDEELILDIADILIDSTVKIKIEGHSDNQPLKNSIIESNYELSALRAAKIAWIFNIVGVGGDRIIPIGLGQNYPVGDNNTPEGRASNRRVVITINEAPSELLLDAIQQ